MAGRLREHGKYWLLRPTHLWVLHTGNITALLHAGAFHTGWFALTMVLVALLWALRVLGEETLQFAGGVALNASQPTVVAVSAVAAVRVLLAVHPITVGLALPVNAVAACNIKVAGHQVQRCQQAQVIHLPIRRSLSCAFPLQPLLTLVLMAVVSSEACRMEPLLL